MTILKSRDLLILKMAHGGSSLKEIASALQLSSASSAKYLIDKLIEAGYLERGAAHSHRTLRLTDEGMKIAGPYVNPRQ